MKKVYLCLCLCFSFAEYNDSFKKDMMKGCKDGGGSKEFCECQLDVVTKNIPQNELIEFTKLMSNLYFNKDSEVSEKHMKWLNKMQQCGEI